MFKRLSTLILLMPLGLPAAISVINTNSAGPGSLYQAILDANANPGPDTISFNISSGGLTISPAGPLPVLTGPVTIDGATQPGYSNAPLVEIDGVAAGIGTHGFILATNGCIVRGLAINRFKGDAIQITNGAGSKVEGCYLGVARDGVTRRGNSGAGVRITSTDFTFSTTASNVVGGTSSTSRNLISGNLYGVYLLDSPGNLISGNFIGTDASGLSSLGNTNSGIYLQDNLSAFNTIGGSSPGAGNLISGNGQGPYTYSADGVTLSYCWSNSVLGNFIGVDVTGSRALHNGQHGVNVQSGGGAHRIGGAAPREGNLLSGNRANGVNFGGGGGAKSTGPVLPDGSVVQGNRIGTDITGMLAVPNENDGVFIGSFSGNTVGGSLPGEGNVISGNFNSGVELGCCNTFSNLVVGNLIGVSLTNAQPLGNQSWGVYADWGPNNIGGVNPGAANLIAFNAAGVVVSYNAQGVALLGNSIYGNMSLGIDLYGNNGVDANDLGDSDSGGNNVQNYPVLGFPLQFPTQTVISGTLNSYSNAPYRIELFDNPARDPSGFGEGQTFLTALNVMTDPNGNASFVVTNPASLPLSHFISATATDTNGNTSEFSFSRAVARPDSIDLSLGMTASTNPAPRSSTFYYSLTITNQGPTNATGVKVLDTLPAGLSFVNASASQGTVTQSAGTVTFTIGNLPARSGAALIITVQPTITGSVFNQAGTFANEFENNPADNTAAVTTQLGVASVGLLLSDSPDPVVAGQTVTYSAVATNLGPDAASNVEVEFFLDANNILTGATVSQGSASQFGTYAVAAFGSIPVHASARLTVTAVPTAVGTNQNYAYLSALESDPDPSDNSGSINTAVLAGPGVIQFTNSIYNISENAGFATVTVQRSGGAIGTVSVDFNTADLTALAGVDYAATNGTLTFLNGVTNQSFRVAIFDHAQPACNKALALRLFHVLGGAVLAGRTNAVLEIFDAHRPPSGLVQAVSLANTNLVAAANGASTTPSISDDGRFVAFVSTAPDLSPTPDPSGSAEIFVSDRVSRSASLVSVNSGGTQAANGYSYNSQISGDGKRVGFLSVASDLTTNLVSGPYQLYVRTLASGQNQLVSANTNGGGANASIDRFTLSTNGSRIAFLTSASDLIRGDTNLTADVFYRDLAAGTNVLVSFSPSGTSANDASYAPKISADGRYIAFASSASNLLPADNNSRLDIYRYDVAGRTNELVSANPAGVAGNDACGSDLFISGDGRFVAFESSATDLASGTPPFYQQVFLRDLVLHSNILVSVNNSGAAANFSSTVRGLSRDGRYVLFESNGDNLFTNDSNFSSDIFVRDTLLNVTVLVDVNLSGAGANGYSHNPVLSASGRYVAFLSTASDLVPGNRQLFVNDAFVRDVQAGTTTLLSTSFGTSDGGNNDSSEIAVGANGVAAFTSYASDLVPLDANFSSDLFARAPGDSAAQLLSASTGVTAAGGATEQRVSGDGTKVAFASMAPNLVTNDQNNTSDVFLRDLVSGTTSLVSINVAGNGSGPGYSDQPRPSQDGRFVAYHTIVPGAKAFAKGRKGFSSSIGQILLRDLTSNSNLLVSVNRFGTAGGNNDSQNPEITPDGRYVVFESLASDLVSNDLSSGSDIFIRDRTTGAAQLVSMNSSGTASGNDASFSPVVSDDGRYVAFESFASNLGPPISSGTRNVFVRDRLLGSNILCSPNLARNNGGNANSYEPCLSADGHYVVFASDASDLVAGDTNNATDIFVFDVLARTLRLASRTPAGVLGNDGAYEPSISADGRYVAFQSMASNLVPNDNNQASDVFVADMLQTNLSLVSVTCPGNASGNDGSQSPQISRNGRYVAFISFASDLAPGDYTHYVANLFRRDLQAGTTVLVSQSRTLQGGVDSYSYDPRISDNGSVISFMSAADDLIFGDSNGSDDAFAWNSAVVSGVDLGVGLTASASPVAPGVPFNYRITVTNYGLASASGVVVTDALPASLTYVSSTTSQGTIATNGHLLTCTAGTLSVASGLSITVNVVASSPGFVTNTAVAASSQTDLNTANNSATTVVQVTGGSPPSLSGMVTNGNQLVLSWPSSASGYNLETTTNLSPLAWSSVTNSISNNGILYYVLLNLNAAERARFYRLHHP